MQPQSSAREPAARNRALWPPELATSGELEVLQAEHLDALARHRGVRDALATPELRALITAVDGSRCRLEALAAAQHNVPEFKRFCELVLGVVYATEDARWSNKRHTAA